MGAKPPKPSLYIINTHRTIQSTVESVECMEELSQDELRKFFGHYIKHSSHDHDMKVFYRFFTHGLNIHNDTTIDGMPLIYYAILFNKPLLLEFLLVVGLKIDRVRFSKKIKIPIIQNCGTRKEVYQVLLKHGLHNAVIDMISGTPLHWAVLYRDIESVKLLLENGADLHVKNIEKRTPLHWAVDGKGKRLIIGYLIMRKLGMTKSKSILNENHYVSNAIIMVLYATGFLGYHIKWVILLVITAIVSYLLY